MDDKTKKELQSATFDRLINHLRERKDVQNIDLMNLANFCRNCLSRWFRDCLLYTSPSPRDATLSRMPSSA